tara:strand:- start:312 stop:569 length:258 start_codon:yes stop_codon:yes gene_type:complete
MNKIQIDKNCQFLKDLESKPNYNGVSLGVYNLITTIGSLKLWVKSIKPSRHFKLMSVKLYFGIDGDDKALLYKLETILKIIKGEI